MLVISADLCQLYSSRCRSHGYIMQSAPKFIFCAVAAPLFGPRLPAETTACPTVGAPKHMMFVCCSRHFYFAHIVQKVDPKTTESVRGASRLMSEKETRMAKEYQALKERNQVMEAQLDSLR